MAGTCLFVSEVFAQQVDANTQWQAVNSTNGSTVTARHETSGVAVGNKLYVFGGRGSKPVEVYDTDTGQWQDLGRYEDELHHFQPVAVNTDIYVLGAMFAGGFPDEQSLPDILVYDTVTETWSDIGDIPEARQRGSAGAVYRDGSIYLVGGNTMGHNGGAVAWLDRYDLATGEWEQLPDAPNARDHFAAAIVDNKLVAAGGRSSDASSAAGVFGNAVAGTDVYDFDTNSWAEGADIPTLRAGTVVASAGGELLVAGGETAGSSTALDTVEAYSVGSDSWRELQSMLDTRHSGASAVIGNNWHVLTGNLNRGGSVDFETTNHEILVLDVDADSDNDGLSDVEENSVYSTNPDDPDSDDDQLNDGFEVGIGSNPLDSDTDDDGLEDGAEQNTHFSSPLLADTDSDLLDDFEEVNEWMSNPALADTDEDALDDGDEVSRGTSPTLADTDEDGLDDGDEIIAGTNPLIADTDEDGLLDGEDPEPLVAEDTGSEGETPEDTGSESETPDEESEPGEEPSDEDSSGSDSGNSFLGSTDFGIVFALCLGVFLRSRRWISTRF